GGGPTASISLTAATDVNLTTLRAASSITVSSTGGSIRDDGNDTTAIQAPNITLTAAQAIGGANTISVNDVLTQGANYLAAIDFDLQGGSLTLSQTGSGGNVQLRRVNSTFPTSILGGFSPAGTGNQLALFSDSGVTVDTSFSQPAAKNVNLMLGSVGGDVNV